MTVTEQDLADYAEIKRWIPETSDKQVKWLKGMIDNARKLYADPNAIRLIRLGADIQDIDLKMQMFRGIKASIGSELARKERQRAKERAKTEHGTQCTLFHPEAFEGGDNTSLRDMPQ